MKAANLVSTVVAKRYQAVPVAFTDKRTLLVAMSDPSNVLAVDDIAIMTAMRSRRVAPPMTSPAWSLAWTGWKTSSGVRRERRGRGGVRGAAGAARDLRRRARCQARKPDRRQAVERSASDIHLAPDGKELRVASVWMASCRTSPRCRAGWPPA